MSSSALYLLPSRHLVDSHKPFLFVLFIPSGQKEEVCLPYDWHTLFTPPSPKPNTSPPSQRSKVCPSACLCVHHVFSVTIFSISILLIWCLMLVRKNSVLCQINLGYGTLTERNQYVVKIKTKKKKFMSKSLKMYYCFSAQVLL